jgi:hypothetical protein
MLNVLFMAEHEDWHGQWVDYFLMLFGSLPSEMQSNMYASALTA